jgi:hypothetical protein
MAAVSCPAPFSGRARAIFRRKADTSGCIRQAIDFSGLRARMPESQDALRALGRFGCARHKLEKPTVAGIALARIARIWPKVQVRPPCRAGACGCKKRWRARCGASRRRSLRPIIARKLTVLARIGAS